MEIISSDWLITSIPIATLVVAIIGIIVALLAWRKPKDQGSATIDPKGLPKPYQTTETPTVHATSGTPSVMQLIEGIELDPKAMGVAESLYDLGLEQYDHPVNNRDGEIDRARREMKRLAQELNPEERVLAAQVGTALAEASERNERENAGAQYQELSPQAKIYAQQKRSEYEALERIARDLEKTYREPTTHPSSSG